MDRVESKGLGNINYREIETVSSKDFEKRVIDYAGPVMVVFVAGWRSASEFLESILNMLNEETQNSALILKFDLTLESDHAAVTEIYSIPLFLYFDHGRIVDCVEGMVSYEVIEGKLKSLIAINEIAD